MTSEFVETKFRVGNKLVPVRLEYIDREKINLHFPYNKELLETVKTSFEGRRWLGPPINPNGPKLWQIPITQRNNFILDYLQMKNPYKKYDDTLKPENMEEYISKVREYESLRMPKGKSLFKHQRELIAHGLMTRTCIWAAEMGVGKTLAAFIFMEMCELLELSISPLWWWVAPESALRAFREQCREWNPRIKVQTMTYESFKGRVLYGDMCPAQIIFDESPKIKTPTSQRSVAARNLCNEMRDLYKGKQIIVLMSGAPAPKSPLDWWHQCEVTEPGYLSEKDIYTFREKLGVFEDANDGAYKRHVTWKDSVDKCARCYEPREHKNHDTSSKMFSTDDSIHEFVPGVDEVSRLNHRLQGLAIFKLKKDCLDLPAKIYEQRILKPTRDTLMTARMIVDGSRRVIESLTKLRMLSDGFQYTETKTGEKACKLCKGTCECEEYFDPSSPDEYIPDEWALQGQKPVFDENDEVVGYKEIEYEKRKAKCPNCNGTGRTDTYSRTAIRIECPKDEALREDLSAHEESGRLCVYAGFTESVDRVVENCHAAGWTTVRADGRGWEGKTPLGEILDNKELLHYFQHGQERYPLMCFVGQPGSAGEGLTLTASHSIIFWSNDFNGNSRMQAEDRGHRPGMDKERGGRIVDYLHLPSDLYVLNNLKLKKDLQRQTMTGLRECYNASPITGEE